MVFRLIYNMELMLIFVFAFLFSCIEIKDRHTSILFFIVIVRKMAGVVFT